MWDLAVREDDYQAVDAMLARYAGAPLSYRIVPAYARADTAQVNRLRDEARALDARQSQIAARYLATYLTNVTAADEIARFDLQPRRNAGIQLGAQSFLAWLEVARGRWSSAKQAFDEAERMEGGTAIRQERALAATLPFLEVPRSDVEAARHDIDSWNAAPPAGNASLTTALRPHYRLYLLGLLSSRLGESDRAEAYVRDLERLSVPPSATNVVTGLAATIRADVAMSRGHAADALKLLSAADGAVPLELVYTKPFASVREYTQEHARYLRAEALLATGRNDEARHWFQYSFQGSPLELAYLAPMHSRLGQLAERAGSPADAVTHLRAFLKLWEQCDATLQPQVVDAAARVRRLQTQ
jgi:tetratricopeptide (TPR) repeat protein